MSMSCYHCHHSPIEENKICSIKPEGVWTFDFEKFGCVACDSIRIGGKDKYHVLIRRCLKQFACEKNAHDVRQHLHKRILIDLFYPTYFITNSTLDISEWLIKNQNNYKIDMSFNENTDLGESKYFLNENYVNFIDQRTPWEIDLLYENIIRTNKYFIDFDYHCCTQYNLCNK
ncbi:hypothetical protein SNEBB_009982 [Seison nebaliae]|nr:hypothetical protein SNEBB_009982 [Seison nebaliae]